MFTLTALIKQSLTKLKTLTYDTPYEGFPVNFKVFCCEVRIIIYKQEAFEW